MIDRNLLLDVQRLEQQSRKSLPFVGIALCLVVAAVVYSAVALAGLQAELAKTKRALQDKRAELARTQRTLLAERRQLEVQNATLKQENDALSEKLHVSTAPLAQVVKPLLTV